MFQQIEILIEKQAAYRELSKLQLKGATRAELVDLVDFVCSHYIPVWTK